MRLLVLPPIFLALAGCTTTKVVEVKVPVPVPCVTEKVEEPVYPVATGSTLFERVKVLLAEIEMRKAYELKLKAAVAGCGEVK